MIIAGTGHRPDKLGGYDDEVYVKLVKFAIFHLNELKPDLVISGMALGWDQALAQAAVNLNIPFHAYIPFKGQEANWFYKSQVYYRSLLNLAEKVVICSDGGYAAWKMQVRNIKMVNACDTLLALWDGSSGGTKNCIDSAKNRLPGDKIINLWPIYVTFSD